ncbi:uncharacterized protein LOC143374917 [Andrena cerasifolii]|uniref:uncharacterized protein LOC143374917 n=1 Tax=Andrena cerasifolii TaxID=2819439 RepID=UPI0040378F7D
MTMSMRESIFSIGSRMLHRYDDLHFDGMTYQELQEMQDGLLQSIWMLTLENDVYERYLTRCNPNIMRISHQAIANILERAKFAKRITMHHLPKSSRMSFRESIMNIHDIGRPSTPSTSVSSGSRFGTPSLLTTKTVGEGSKITMAHRITMANKEVEEMRKKLNGFVESSRKRKTNVRAEIEEVEIRIREVQEAKEEFEEEVVVNGVDSITGKIPAERVTR